MLLAGTQPQPEIFTVVLLKIQVFWNVMQCGRALVPDAEDRSANARKTWELILQNVSKYSPVTASHHKRLEFSRSSGSSDLSLQ